MLYVMARNLRLIAPPARGDSNRLEKEKKPKVICVNPGPLQTINFRFGPFDKKEGAGDNLEQFKRLYNNEKWR